MIFDKEGLSKLLKRHKKLSIEYERSCSDYLKFENELTSFVEGALRRVHKNVKSYITFGRNVDRDDMMIEIKSIFDNENTIVKMEQGWIKICDGYIHHSYVYKHKVVHEPITEFDIKLLEDTTKVIEDITGVTCRIRLYKFAKRKKLNNLECFDGWSI